MRTLFIPKFLQKINVLGFGYGGEFFYSAVNFRNRINYIRPLTNWSASNLYTYVIAPLKMYFLKYFAIIIMATLEVRSKDMDIKSFTTVQWSHS